MLSDENCARTCWAAISQILDTWNITVPPWACIPGWWQAGMRQLVRLARQGGTPEDLHGAWAAMLRREGFEPGARRLDGPRRSHPWLKPWAELTGPERLIFDVIQGLSLRTAAALPRGLMADAIGHQRGLVPATPGAPFARSPLPWERRALN